MTGDVTLFHVPAFATFLQRRSDPCKVLLDLKLVGHKMAATYKYRLWSQLRIGDRRTCF